MTPVVNAPVGGAARARLHVVRNEEIGRVPDLDALLTAVGRGDEDAFAALYDAVAPRVLGLVRRILRDPAQSEEVTQEVLLEIWRTAPVYDATRGSAGAWILTVAHRRAVDRVRSAAAASARETRAAATLGPEGGGPAYDEVVEAVEARWEADRVRRALDVLTPVQREAIRLAYYGGRTHTEVASLLDVPLGTVKTRLRDAVIRLRDELGVTT